MRPIHSGCRGSAASASCSAASNFRRWTGAARGIGLATTKSFLAAGWRVAMIDRDAPALAEAAGGLAPGEAHSDTMARRGVILGRPP